VLSKGFSHCSPVLPHRPISPPNSSPHTPHPIAISWSYLTMQAAVQPLPAHLMPSYQRPSISNVVNRNSTVLPTPPIATRKRKRVHQYTVSYSEVQEVDTDGRLREIIVIEDTPPPPTASPATSSRTNGYSASYQPPTYSAPIRTRARAAMEAQAESSGSSSVALPIPAPKKRKRELDEAPSTTKKGFPPAQTSSNTAKHAAWTNGGVTTSATVGRMLFSR
jgi:dual-specificity kinase